MLITRRTKTGEVIPFLNDERMEYVLKNIPPYPLPKPLLKMTVGEFVSTQEDGYVVGLLKEKRAYKALGMLRQFKTEMEQVNSILRQNEVPETAEVRQAAAGVVFPSSAEAILIEVAEFLHLDDLEKAGNIPVSQWLMIHRKKTAEQRFQYNLNKIHEAKQKQGKNRRR